MARLEAPVNQDIVGHNGNTVSLIKSYAHYKIALNKNEPKKKILDIDFGIEERIGISGGNSKILSLNQGLLKAQLPSTAALLIKSIVNKKTQETILKYISEIICSQNKNKTKIKFSYEFINNKVQLLINGVNQKEAEDAKKKSGRRCKKAAGPSAQISAIDPKIKAIIDINMAPEIICNEPFCKQINLSLGVMRLIR